MTENTVIVVSQAELRLLLRETISEFLSTSERNPSSSEPRQKLRGIRQLASYIPCGIAKAQELKNQGVVPFSKCGNRLLFDPSEVDQALRKLGSGQQ